MSLCLGRFCRRTVVRPAFVVVVATVAAFGGASSGSATTFGPTWTAALSDSDPGAAASLTFHLDIPAPDANFSKLIAFIPPQFSIANGDDVPNGAYAGNVTALATLGLIGNSCASNLSLEIQMMDASTDPSMSIPPYYGTTDGNGNGLPDNVDYYPALMSQIAPNLVPLQRLYGQVLVAGTQIPLNFVIFAPGTPIPLLPAFDASLGYPTVTIVGDPFSVPEPSFPVTDFCTPLSTSVVLNGVAGDNPNLPGNQGGHTLRTNPPEAGVYNSVIFARSQWDADDDGIENNIDPCPLTPDPTWNPRVDGGPGDDDDDGLPDSCDPSAASILDNDADQYPNRGDLCPTIAAGYIHYDRDHDAIGDECDPFPDDETNGGAAHRHQLCVADTLVVGSPASLDPPAWTCPNGPDIQVPPVINLYPLDGVEVVGAVHSVQAYVRRAGLDGEAAPGVTVEFAVSGANAASGNCLTDNWGSCEFNYLGANSGTDTVTATATVEGMSVEAKTTAEWVAPPPNDDFSAATQVPGIPFVDEVPLIAAHNEFDEPSDCFPMANTVWYRFTPGDTAYVTIEAATNDMPLALAAYIGSSLTELALVNCDTGIVGPPGSGLGLGLSPVAGDGFYFENYLTFSAQAGVTYQIQVGLLHPLSYYPGMTQISIHYAPAGDANCSADLSVLDALQVLRFNAGLSSDDCAPNGDVNCDGVLTAVDALVILRVVAGIIPPPAACKFG